MHLSSSILTAGLASLAARANCHETQSPPQDATASPSYRSHLLSLHKALIEIDSTSGIEASIGAYLTDYFALRDWSTLIEFVPSRENTPDGVPRMNVLAWPSVGVPDPRVLVTSHMDAVPPFIPYHIDAHDENDITKDTMISGRGSVDAKGSVAAMIVALEDLLASDKISARDVMMAFVVGEEVAGDGMRWLDDALHRLDSDIQPHFDAVVFGEPTENKLACGHKGGLACTITAHGIPGHSGYPWLGKSANELLVRAMARIFDTDLGSSDEFGNTTVNLGRMQGGVAANVIPEKAVGEIMARVALGPQETGGKVVQERIQKILDEVDDEAFEFDCQQGYGFVNTNCDVDGTYRKLCLSGEDRELTLIRLRLRDHGSQLRNRHSSPIGQLHQVPLRSGDHPRCPRSSREPDCRGSRDRGRRFPETGPPRPRERSQSQERKRRLQQ